jgi:ABC-2 type transport system permease protein
MWRATKALFIKDIKITLRNRPLLVASILIPVVFIFLYSLVIQISATTPIVIARQSHGAHSDAFVKVLTEMKSVDGPYFEIQTLKPATAFERYKKRKVGALIEIPPSFDSDVARSVKPTVRLHIHNINSDSTKNYQLRLSHAIYAFQRQTNPEITITEVYSAFPKDIQVKLYVAVALLMFAVIYGSMVNTGILMVREWEERTGKEMSLSPKGFAPFIAGKWITAFAQTIVSTTFIIGIMWFTLGFSFAYITPVVLLLLLAMFLFGASLGAWVGSYFRKTVPVVSFSGMITLFIFLICGNESVLRGMADSSLPRTLWKISIYIPISQITENIRQVIVFPGSGVLWEPLFWTVLFGLVFSFLSARQLRKVVYQHGQ